MGISGFYRIIFLRKIPWNMTTARRPSPCVPGPLVYGSRHMVDGLRLVALDSHLTCSTPFVEITIKGQDLISAKGYSTSNLRRLSHYGRLRPVSPVDSGAEHALTAVPWAVTFAAHRDGLSVLGSQCGSCLRPRNDMKTPVVLTSIGSRWQRRGVMGQCLGLR
jgi:hypothetical protein